MKRVKFTIQEHGPFRLLRWELDAKHDSVWDVHAASDGNIYFSSCSEGTAASAHLLRFDISENRLWDILDIGELSGDRWDSGRVPQSKIHTCLQESSDGFLYGVSHCTAPNAGETLFEVQGSFGDPEFGFRGSQMFRVRMADGAAEHLGTAVPFEGCRSMVYLERSRKAYLVSYPRHCLYEYDLPARRARMLGRIGTLGGFEIFRDSRDRIYGSYDDGQFFRYWPDRDEFEDLPLRVPGIPGREKLYNFFFFSRTFRKDFVVAAGYYDMHLFRFNPEAEPQGSVEDYGLGWPGGWNRKDWTPPYVQAPVLYRDRWLFYGCNPIWEPTRLVRLDTRTRRKKIVAVLNLDGNPSAWLSQGALAADGRTLVFGEVNMNAVPRLVLADAARLKGENG